MTDYELIDSGNLQKFERFGAYKFIRPEPQAIWSPNLKNWQADAVFLGAEEEGRWKLNSKISQSWEIKCEDLKILCKITPFRHLGFFPEQITQWNWAVAQKPENVLNLFGYTGVASLILAKNNVKVTHVDASKKSVLWAKENQKLSGLEDKPIRWIVDDALKFVQREVNRNSTYDGIILDPPKFGRGPEGEIWKIEESLPTLLAKCKSLNPKFVILTTYALRLSALSLANLMTEIFGKNVTSGELTLPESSSHRLLPQAIFARWNE